MAAPAQSHVPRIVAFLGGDGRDGSGRRFEDVLAFDDAAIDGHHDFIQWLFPLAEPSRMVAGAPVLDAGAIAALKASPLAQERLRRAAAWMLAFYARSPVWRRPSDHNHLRITRIIKSLRLLAGDDTADAFKGEVTRLAAGLPIPAGTRAYWTAA